ncbi:phytanoyl-CoA dioxygenase family protein [Calothrix rhizosoleniae]|uniref:phytanoyl-CoA dioxygenase family protein n=1 Tax=Calothrix rhizosoleniae TaxID=888997 RepID=UPI000B4A499A|nr:phytanoyl-CoA dioxygenase family protein [Calothrix rhizosoleniae]
MERRNNLFTINSPTGEEIKIPLTVDSDSDIYSSLKTPEDIQNYYHENGYVVIRNLIPSELCDVARKFFATEIKPYQKYLYRQATANPEKHVLTSHGYMLNSLLNIQDINTKKFPNFKQTGLSILTHENIQKVVSMILGEPGTIIQTMYFEGNPATWAHQDTYYLDSTELGKMTAVWVAVEDIQPGAGRFYVYPGSHKIDMANNGGDFDIAFNHTKYKELVIDIIKKYQLKCHAPALKKGDAFFWNSKTIHGSLETSQPEYSRSSFTAHFIPSSTEHLQYQKRVRKFNLKQINAMNVDHPKDLDNIKNQLFFSLETQFPKQIQYLKRLAIKAIVK